MIKKAILVIFAVLLSGAGFGLYLLQHSFRNDIPQFTSFSSIDTSLYQQANMTDEDSHTLDETVFLIEYPVDDLQNEIQRLKSLVADRTDSARAQYLKENEDIMQIEISEGNTLENYIGKLKKPLTNEIYNTYVGNLQAIIAREKIKHDIARPMQIDLSINAPVTTPSTPSYPSMFAAEVIFIKGLLKELIKEDDYLLVSEKLDEAIRRRHMFGVSTKFDTDYGSAIAEEYFNTIQSNIENKEFFAFTQEREWSHNESIQLNINNSNRDSFSDIQILDSWSDTNGTVVTFNSDIENIGSKNTPVSFNAFLEIDQFSDGVIDKTIEIPVARLSVGDTRMIGYSLVFSMPGDHRFRFVVNPQIEFLEDQMRNNFGVWTGFSI